MGWGDPVLGQLHTYTNAWATPKSQRHVSALTMTSRGYQMASSCGVRGNCAWRGPLRESRVQSHFRRQPVMTFTTTVRPSPGPSWVRGQNGSAIDASGAVALNHSATITERACLPHPRLLLLPVSRRLHQRVSAFVSRSPTATLRTSPRSSRSTLADVRLGRRGRDN